MPGASRPSGVRPLGKTSADKIIEHRAKVIIEDLRTNQSSPNQLIKGASMDGNPGIQCLVGYSPAKSCFARYK